MEEGKQKGEFHFSKQKNKFSFLKLNVESNIERDKKFTSDNKVYAVQEFFAIMFTRNKKFLHSNPALYARNKISKVDYKVITD